MLLEAHRVAPDRFSRPLVVSTVEPPVVSGSAELTVEAPVEPL